MENWIKAWFAVFTCWSLFVLFVRMPPPLERIYSTCGDGVLGWDEQCEDFNARDGDGCSSTCEVENHPELPLKPWICYEQHGAKYCAHPKTGALTRLFPCDLKKDVLCLDEKGQLVNNARARGIEACPRYRNQYACWDLNLNNECDDNERPCTVAGCRGDAY